MLAIAAARAELAEDFGRETNLAGSWILERAGTRIPGLWMPGLKRFVALGILIRTGGSRGGHRAYYRLADLEGMRRALHECGVVIPDASRYARWLDAETALDFSLQSGFSPGAESGAIWCQSHRLCRLA